MGILNRTPDSFYDGGRLGLAESVERALAMVEEGAEVIDVGGVKAGPGRDVPVIEEIERVVPLVEALRRETDVRLSVETGRAEVASEVLGRGVDMINDVTGLADEKLAEVCASAGATLVLMHHGGQIRGRPRNPRYDDVVRAVVAEWERLQGIALGAGMDKARLVVDPGLDFGKNVFHSLELMRRLPELVAQGLPVLVAASRKDVVGEALDLPLEARLEGSLALVALSALHGASYVRVHDVKESSRVVAMVQAVQGARLPAAPVRGLWE